MNTSRVTPATTRTIALTACLAALYTGTAACGSDHDTATAPAGIAKPASVSNARTGSRAVQESYLRQLRAKHAAATRTHSFGDDRRQPTTGH
jgi:hypothetical protein